MEDTQANGEAKDAAAKESTEASEKKEGKAERSSNGVETVAGEVERKPLAAVNGSAPPESLEELVRQEIEANRLSVQRLCTWGVLAVVCLMSYLAWLHQSVQDNFFNPETVAAFISGTIDEQLPSILGRTEREIIDNAPMQAQAVSRKIQESIPQVRKVAEQQIENIYVQMPLLRETLNASLRTYFAEHRNEMKEFADAHKDAEFVRYFTTHLLSEMEKEIHIQLGSGDELDLKKVQEQSLGQLVVLNERLKKLAETSPYYMNRRDIVARRLVAVYASMLHESAGELAAAME